ncbi:uncharacterized protein LOC108815696 [Raphanus sativus]|uniref:Uncharacterized protein LOC108815696 n=1 Tax=Raphanus sativus TaxID=3726 RepID=A0A6J0LVH9_RAPSA|nr:uncharacterized protein LOC108815696 [Raphanus sativus]
METIRGSSFNQQENEFLYCVYLEISQHSIGSNNQSLRKI